MRPQAGDTVVEIGPGLGALTGPLLERAGRLHVVEIDRDLASRLRKRFEPEHAPCDAALGIYEIKIQLRSGGHLLYWARNRPGKSRRAANDDICGGRREAEQTSQGDNNPPSKRCGNVAHVLLQRSYC